MKLIKRLTNPTAIHEIHNDAVLTCGKSIKESFKGNNLRHYGI